VNELSQSQDGNPCNECVNCLQIINGTTMDIVEIDAASHTWVDNIREEILDRAMYAPSVLKKKVYIIDEVHMLSKWAFNALLKIMEEPQDYVCFILATTEIHKIPDTIMSRCQVFNFWRVALQPMIQRLAYIAQQENIHTEEAWLALIAKLSAGGMRDAIKYLDQVRVLWDVTEKHVSEFLWVVSDARIQEFVELLAWYVQKKIQYETVASFLGALQTSGIDMYQCAKDILIWIHEHFMDQPDVYARIADNIKDIMKDMKRYPEPVMAYKTVLLQELK